MATHSSLRHTSAELFPLHFTDLPDRSTTAFTVFARGRSPSGEEPAPTERKKHERGNGFGDLRSGTGTGTFTGEGQLPPT